MSRMGQGALGPKGRRVADVQSSWGLGAPPKGPTLAEDRFAGAETQTHAPGPQVRHSIHQATAAPEKMKHFMDLHVILSQGPC